MGSAAESRNAGSRARGFTLLELMVVLLILSLIATIAAPRVTKYLHKAKVQTASVQVDALSAAVDSFHLDTGRFPTAEEGLHALIDKPADTPGWDGPYLKKQESLIDPWGHPYGYRLPGRTNEYDIYTLGADGRGGGEADARNSGK
jgi:general secretion pathway protein G